MKNSKTYQTSNVIKSLIVWGAVIFFLNSGLADWPPVYRTSILPLSFEFLCILSLYLSKPGPDNMRAAQETHTKPPSSFASDAILPDSHSGQVGLYNSLCIHLCTKRNVYTLALAAKLRASHIITVHLPWRRRVAFTLFCFLLKPTVP